MDINQIKTNRFLFLQLLYKDSNGDTSAHYNMWEIGEELKLDRNETKRIVEYLIGEYLIEPASLGGGIQLTHLGVKEVEEAMENPNSPTEHFLAMNVINIGTMNNSTVQQATVNSTANFHFDESKSKDLDGILKLLKDIQDKLNLSFELQQELIIEIETLEIQKKSPNPKSTIISEALKSIRTILESVTGNAMTPVIIDQITRLIS